AAAGSATRLTTARTAIATASTATGTRIRVMKAWSRFRRAEPTSARMIPCQTNVQGIRYRRRARFAHGRRSGRGPRPRTRILTVMGHAHTHTAAGRHRWQLAAAMALSVGILVVEGIAAWRSHSLALFADAAHVFADVSGIGL